MPIRIMIADDHPDLRRGIRHLLETHPDWQVCAEAVDGLDAIEKAASMKPDILILDLSMPRMNGLQAARVIHAAAPDLPLLLCSVHASDEPLVTEFRSAGFRGAISKHQASLLPEAIARLLEGKEYFPSSLTPGSSIELDAAGAEDEPPPATEPPPPPTTSS
jgi:DNA-binding NarL/FixJ family response regulator